MKKYIGNLSVLILVLLLVLSLMGCGKKDKGNNSQSGSSNNTSTSYKDGEYKESASSYDDSGFKATVRVVIKNGSVYSVDCDADSKDTGTKKSLSESGRYDMKTGGAQYDWHEEIAFFEKHVVSHGLNSITLNKEGKTDVVTGCTIKVGEYVDLIKKALDKASE